MRLLFLLMRRLTVMLTIRLTSQVRLVNIVLGIHTTLIEGVIGYRLIIDNMDGSNGDVDNRRNDNGVITNKLCLFLEMNLREVWSRYRILQPMIFQNPLSQINRQ